ncbi:hypothetical protein [Ornithinimicrobium avium]|uniref:Uncharacterized protein n=1 Tax=Ornithinimicrobium avium TaxID=2283195 RepID=A0A345NKB5_9MICO|nr:hypothetical protein [Ornithinimicrobium avium]AXH95473.1 hypothetical protein DV701_04410 [Ornithinimicrobium avium]
MSAPHPRIATSGLTAPAAHMAWVWAAVAVVVLVVGFGTSPVQVIADLLANQGVSDAQSRAMWFAAGFTLPLVVGTCAAVLVLGWNLLGDMEWPGALFTLCACFGIPGLLSSWLRLGLSPDWAASTGTGPWYVMLPMRIFTAYLSSYGFPLLVVGLALGFGLALQMHRWFNRPEEIVQPLLG